MNRIRGHIKYPVIAKKAEVVAAPKTQEAIKLPANRSRFWTEQENEYLKKVYPSMSIALIAEHLKRSPGAVSHQAGVLNVATRTRGSKSHRGGTDNWGWRKGF